jgi:hypothetical protein
MNDPMPAVRSILGMPEAEVVPIDHRAEAEEILSNRGSVNDPNGLATAHAVLYLADQQRIANLIAIFRLEPYWADRIVDDETTVLATIQEGLGL